MATTEEPNDTSQEEILFIEDRRPGNVSPVFQNLNSQSNSQKEDRTQDFLGDFIPLSSNSFANDEDKNFNSYKNLSSEEADGTTEHQSSSIIDMDGSLRDDLCFVMEDRSPLLTGQETQSPRYRISENFLKLQSPSPKGGPKRKLANPCFNCGDTGHPLRDCPHPRNQREIYKNRKEFMDSKPVMPVYKRYHLSGGQEQFAGCVPGTISKELRHALGLEENELPTHIYMMRRLGYPPGWLREAVVSHSGISMFDGQGKEVVEPGNEEGKVHHNKNMDKYDIRKIIHYPGFNVPPPSGTLEDAHYWHCPPMSKRQSVEAMLEMLEGRVVGGYKRKKLSRNVTGNDLDETSQSTESRDMEYEEISESVELPEDNCKFVPPLPEGDLPPPPPLESPESPDPIKESPDSPEPETNSKTNSIKESPDSPEPETNSKTNDSTLSTTSTSIEETSILELEEQKKLLLAELNDTSPLCGTPDSKIGKTKAVEFGTPILQSVSPFTRLPSSEKFSLNICDVINFENLPDSTGKYEQMSGIIKRVRHKLKEINDEP